MNFHIYAFLTVFLPSLALAQNKVNVTVYYESLCPDSQRFFNNQLYKAYISPLVMYMNLVLVPYGNAKVNATTGQIVCQHGVAECYGNKIQACAIEKVSNGDKEVKYINCLMQVAYDKKPTNETAYKAVMNACSNLTDMESAIEQCAASMDGTKLIYKYGNMTMAAKPPIKGVPTIFFDQKSSDTINDNAMKNFVDELCKHITGTKPNECGTKGGASGVMSSLLLVVPAIIISRYNN